MILITRTVYPRLAFICHCVASSLRLAPALILVLGIAFGSVASAQTAHFSYAQVTVGSGVNQPAGVAVDGSGNVFVADQGANAVYEIVAVDGVVSNTSTVKTVGGGFSSPTGVAVDGNGNVFVADYSNSAVKEIVAVGGVVSSTSTVNTLGSGFRFPTGVAVDGSGNVFIADSGNNAVKEILAAGGYIAVNTLGSGFSQPQGVAVDASGDVFVADTNNNAVEEIEAAGNYTTVNTLGSGFGYPSGVAVDGSGNVFVVDHGNSALKEILAAGGYTTVNTLGSGFSASEGIAVDGSGNVFLADVGIGLVVKLETGAVDFGSVAIGQKSAAISLTFTFDSSGSIELPSVLTQGAARLDFADAGTGSCNTDGTAHTYNAGDTCTVDVTFAPKFAGPRYGAVVLSDVAGNVIATGNVHGSGTGPQVSFLPGSQLTVSGSFVGPDGVAVDGSGNVFVADSNAVIEVLAAGGYVTVKALGSGHFTIGAAGVAVDGSGNVFVADPNNNAVKEILAAGGYVTVKALGSGFNQPMGVAVDGNGNVFVADFGNNAVKEILAVGGYTTVNPLGSGFSQPVGVAVDGNGNVFVADFGNNAVKEILAAGGYTTVNPLGSGFSQPMGVAVDGNGNVFVADHGNGRVKEILAASGYTTVNTLVVETWGGGFYQPMGVAVDGSGNVFVTYSIYYTSYGYGVMKLDYADAPSLSFASTDVGLSSFDSPHTVTVQNIGNAPLTFTGLSYPTDFPESGADDCSTSTPLAAGASCPLTISFTPTTAAYLSETVALTDNNLNTASTQNITVSGTGEPHQTTPTIVWSPPPTINFGSNLSALLNATAQDPNTGNPVAGTFSYIARPSQGGADAPVTASTILGPGSYSLFASFTPTDTVDYYLVSRVASLTVVPTFGTVNVGVQNPVTRALTVTIPSASTISSVSVVTQGAPGLDFTDAGTGTCTTNGPAYPYNQGDTCTVNVNFTPTAIGVRMGAVVLNSPSWNWMDGTGPETFITGTGVGAAIAFGPGAISTVAGNGTAGYSGDGNAATSAQLNLPGGLALDSAGNLYFSEFGNSTVRMVTPQGVISTVAGTGTAGYNGDGLATAAQLNEPSGLAMDGAGNLYIMNYGDGSLRVVNPATQAIMTMIPPGGYFDHLTGFAVDSSGGLYISLAWENFVIDNEMMVGTGDPGYSGDGGPASQAQLNFPTGLAVDGAGNLYIADSKNKVIRMVNHSGIISTVAGNANSQSAPCSGDGSLAINADLQGPGGVTVDAAGNLYISDYICGRIRKVTPAGIISTVAGDGNMTYGGDGGPATSAHLNLPAEVVADSKGNLYIADSANFRVRKVDVSDVPSLSFADTQVGSTSVAQDVSVANVGNAQLNISQITTAVNFNLQGADTSCTSGGQMLNQAASCILGVEFAPQTPGPNPGAAIVLSDDALSGRETISLSGDGLAQSTTATGITLTVNPAPASMLGQSVTLTVVVSSSAGTPAGSVSFMDGSTALGTATLDNKGTATLTLSTLSVGPHSVTAVYAGNAYYAGSTSSAASETVEDFDFSVNGTPTATLSATVLPGNSATYTLLISPSGSTFASAVTLTLTGLPTDATYTITPSIIPAGSSATTVTVTVNTAKTSASSSSPHGGIAFREPLVLAIFLPLLGTRKLRRALRLHMKASMLTLLTLGVLMATGMTACGGRSALPATQTTPMTLAGTSGVLHHSVTLNLTIQ